MKSCDVIVKEIRAWVVEYHRVRQSCSIDKLLDIQDEIAIRSLTLASHVSDYKTSFNAHYFIRRIGVAKSSLQYQKNEMKQGRADTQALVDNATEYEIEQQHEATAVMLELLLKQTNIILSGIQQRISYMKQEKMVTSRQNQT
jgi:hypothetical protein